MKREKERARELSNKPHNEQHVCDYRMTHPHLEQYIYCTHTQTHCISVVYSTSTSALLASNKINPYFSVVQEIEVLPTFHGMENNLTENVKLYDVCVCVLDASASV